METSNKIKLCAAIACVAFTGVAVGAVAIEQQPLSANQAVWAGAPAVNCYDELTANKFAATTTTYKDFTCGRYVGNSAKTSDGGIQLRASKSSGIVTTSSPGTLQSIEIEWNAATYGDRQVDVYGKDTAYTSAADLYNSNQGTLIGSLVLGGDLVITISDPYPYIGLRSKNRSLYVDSFILHYQK